jgi:hypothetical protein
VSFVAPPTSNQGYGFSISVLGLHLAFLSLEILSRAMIQRENCGLVSNPSV